MGNYKYEGKEVLYKKIHIADTADVDTARTIAVALNERSINFIEDALRTCSPNFYGERVSRHNFVTAMNAAIAAGNALDKIKKSLFYGRDNNLEPVNGQQDVSNLPDKMLTGEIHDEQIFIDLIHGIIGKFTEATELLEALRNAYNGNGFDFVNMNEEIGDGFWYDAILLDRSGSTFEEVQAKIIAKLRARFPDKYADASANERDLAAERAILEDAVSPLVDEAPYMSAELGSEPIDDNIGAAEALNIAPSKPASGPEAVNEAAASADKAFADVAAVQANVGKYEPPVFDDPELAKSNGERMAKFPQENMAQGNAKGLPDKKNDG